MGEPQNSLLALPDDLIKYMISLLHNEVPTCPNISIDEWNRFLMLLEPQSIIPYLYTKIRSLSPVSSPPKNILDDMRKKYLRNVKSSIYGELQTQEILVAFKKEGIQSIVLKGLAFAHTLYPDSGGRSYTDIDLLVKPEDFIRSRKIMDTLGYACNKNCFDISKNWFIEDMFIHRNNPKYLLVEIHWNLLPFYRLGNIDIGRIFNESSEINLTDLKFRTLNPVDSLIFSAVHQGLNHSREIKLSWIMDIALLCNQLHTKEEWGTLNKRSVDQGACLALRDTLTMAQLWTGLEIPFGFNDFSVWSEPTKNELIGYSYATEKRNKLVSAIKLKWPSNSNIFEKARILRYLMSFIPYILKSNNNR